MNTVIIGCETIRNELEYTLKDSGCVYPVCWIESGLHNVPLDLHRALQDAIDSCGEVQRILLAMGFCGNSLIGLRSKTAELIFPLVDDCISLLCGSCKRRASFLGTYFFTAGWLKGARSIWAEYQHAVQRYGQKRADRIFHTMLKNYQYAALLDTGCYDTKASSLQVRQFAEAFHLQYTAIEGTIDYLRGLLAESPDPQKFGLVPPGTSITEAMLHPWVPSE